MADDDTILKQAKKAFERCHEADNHNRASALEDIRFAKLGEQWPDEVYEQRKKEQRPCLTINKMPAFIRQVVNDSRQNKPSIKVHPVDDNADRETAEVINGLIRNIEYSSNADVAYDTAVECAVTAGFGYFRVGMDYAYDDAFDMDLTIERINNPFSVYGDPNSTAADSSDWNVAFVVEPMPKDEFEEQYKGKANVDFGSEAWEGVSDPWLDDNSVLIAEYWVREEVDKTIYLLQNHVTKTQQVADEDSLQDEVIANGLALGLITFVTDKETGLPKTRTSKGCKVTQYIMSGAEVLETNEWPGKYIPIVPVYGDEFDVEGKRYFRSLIHNSKDAQRMFNYWRTSATELVALAPKSPYIGPASAFAGNEEIWATANTKPHAFLPYEGNTPPQRQPLDSGVAAGALQEALNASDDMKAIIGLYDASMGARSNETSGRAIMARQREGDVATFHFIDNLARAIRHAGRILIDLIPKVYDTPRIVRILGEDGTEEAKPINQQYQKSPEEAKEPNQEQAIMAMHDLTSGKYDLTVTTGPSFTTKREEAAFQMTEFIRAFPAAAPVIGDILARNLDWPGADEIAKRLEKINPAKQADGIPPELQQAIQQGQQMIQQLQQENARLKDGHDIKAFDAQTKRMKAEGEIQVDSIETGVNILEKIDQIGKPEPQSGNQAA